MVGFSAAQISIQETPLIPDYAIQPFRIIYFMLSKNFLMLLKVFPFG